MIELRTLQRRKRVTLMHTDSKAPHIGSTIGVAEDAALSVSEKMAGSRPISFSDALFVDAAK
jgi:hypothetical protein